MADTVLKGFWLRPEVVDELERFRAELQRTSPFKVSKSDAATVAIRCGVSSGSAAIAADQPLPVLQPTQDRPPDRDAGIETAPGTPAPGAVATIAPPPSEGIHPKHGPVD